MLLGDLSPGDRQKITTVCTIDVHARDIVASLIAQKVKADMFPCVHTLTVAKNLHYATWSHMMVQSKLQLNVLEE